MLFQSFIFLVLVSSHLVFPMHKAIIVFGPSCSGKSTLSRKICVRLDSGWEHIDRDDLIDDNVIGSQDLAACAAHINKRLQTTSVVVDTNLYSQEFFDQIKAHQKIAILIYNPLQKLLERDVLRTQKFNRTDQRAQRARAFVISGYATYFSGDPKYKTPFLEQEKQVYTPYAHDLCVSGSEEDIDKIMTQIRTLLDAPK